MICMAMIKGITVTLYEKEKINEDPFGKLIYKETPTKVENVLVASTNTQEVLDALNLTGKKAVYTIAIPKGDKHTWKDNKVEFFGEIWKVIGFPQQGIEQNIPLEWNQKWITALLRSEEMRATIQKHAERIAGTSGGTVETYVAQTRAVAEVTGDDGNNSLLKAVGK